MRKYAVIVAGGAGLRMGGHMPKQFLSLRGKPILYYTVQQFLLAYPNINIIIALPADFIEEGKRLVFEFENTANIQIVEGGLTRFHSVKNGLAEIKEDGIVFVHDGVRCLVSIELIQRCYEQAVQMGSAIPAVAATDSIRIIEAEQNIVADRNHVRIIQTPQTFQTSLLLPAFEREFEESFTDEATVLEATGIKVHLIEGEYTNIKITRPIDLLIADKILAEKKNNISNN
jgi:2-C-methyl-D-erythritol 4-phosphate cytidylyltransferase